MSDLYLDTSPLSRAAGPSSAGGAELAGKDGPGAGHLPLWCLWGKLGSDFSDDEKRHRPGEHLADAGVPHQGGVLRLAAAHPGNRHGEQPPPYSSRLPHGGTLRGLYPGLCKPAFWDCPGRRLGYSPGRTAGQGGQPAGGCLRHHPNPSPCAGCGQGAPHGPPRRALRGRPHLGGGYGHRLSQGFAGGKDSRAGDRGGCQAFSGLSQLPGAASMAPTA